MSEGDATRGAADIESADAELVDQAIRRLLEGDVQGAARQLLDVVSRTPTPYVYRFERDGTLHIKFWDEEEFTLFSTQTGHPTQIVWLKSAYPRAYYYLGFIQVKLGNNADAIRWLDAGMALEPDQPLFQLEKAKALSGMRQHELALALYEQVAQKGPELRVRIRAAALRGKGFQLIELGRLNPAEQAFRESLELDPENPIALNELDYIEHLRAGGSQAPTETVQAKLSGPKQCNACGVSIAETGGTGRNIGGQMSWLCRTCDAKQPPPAPPKKWWQFWKQ
ncbi:hypothetical protein [Hyalangium versicolor]|uniref:hypothetical protein n=1 Tax=Hyalangium versicolor TaxID=2861190 RepID=UPI001CC8F52C|nr:hypothetical protein [Hyalangium versicolor]